MKRVTVTTILLLSLSLLLTLFVFSCEKSNEYRIQSINSPEAKVGESVVCPVMGTKFTVKDNTQYFTYNGKKYYVCCPECIEELKKNPEKYLNK